MTAMKKAELLGGLQANAMSAVTQKVSIVENRLTSSLPVQVLLRSYQRRISETIFPLGAIQLRICSRIRGDVQIPAQVDPVTKMR